MQAHTHNPYVCVQKMHENPIQMHRIHPTMKDSNVFSCKVNTLTLDSYCNLAKKKKSSLFVRSSCTRTHKEISPR